ncbi:FxSxx-COOH system tetratricopeptide repeat protein [Streptomyces sp. NPDC001135]
MTGPLARPEGGKIVTFYSYKGGTGRTMALANTAWIMASQGKRVLVVDWDLEAPGVAGFLRPFLEPNTLRDRPGVLDLLNDHILRVDSRWGSGHPGATEEATAWVSDQADITRAVSPLQWTFPARGRLDFISAGRQDRAYSCVFSQFNWNRFYEDQYGGRFLDALCARFRSAYDYVLVDSRSGLGDMSDVCTIHLADVLVNCFTYNDQSIEGAAAVARRVTDICGDRRVRILPVPMRVEDSDADRLEAARAKVRLMFDRSLERTSHVDPSRYWGDVEVPYKPAYAYEEILATFRDEPGVPASLLAACERLTAVITEDDVTFMAPMTGTQRRHYLEAAVRRRSPGPTHVYLSYVPEDRMWADWIRWVLTQVGFTVGDARSEDGSGAGVPLRADIAGRVHGAVRTVAVLSAAYQRSPQARAVWEAVAVADPMGSRRVLVPVRVSDSPPEHPFSDRTPLPVGTMTEVQARNALLRALDAQPVQGEHPEGDIVTGPRFPGEEPPVWSAPPRNAAFTGRTDLLEELHRTLADNGTATLLHGMGGVGKTQLAAEYAHRYRGAYDVVWWIEAESGDLALRRFAELAPRLGLEEQDGISATADVVRGALRRGEPYDRWLLVLDNASSPESVESLLVDSPVGHVLITSRNAGRARIGRQIQVEVFWRAESVAHLLHRVSAISAEDADRVAEALGDLPLAVDQAAAWLNETGRHVDEYLALLTWQLDRPAGDADTDAYPLGVGAIWNPSSQQLNSPVARRLLQLCAYFGADPLSFDLVHGREMSKALGEVLPGGDGTALVYRAVQQLRRHALARVDPSRRGIRMHRLVQAAVRSSMTEAEQEQALRVVRDVLAGARPCNGDVEDPRNWSRYQAVWPHLETPWTRQSLDDDIRCLMTERLRYLRARGEYAQAVSLGEDLLSLWQHQTGAHDRWTLHLRFEIANTLRAQGRYAQALEVDQDVYHLQREALGDNDAHTLMTAGGLCADLRAAGRVHQALEVGRETYERSVELLGEDHPQALVAADHLAVALRLAGNCFDARTIDQETHGHRTLTLGQKHPYTLVSLINLGRDLRSCGAYEDSAQILRHAHEAAVALGVASGAALEAAKALAITLRRLDSIPEAMELSLGVLAVYRGHLGDASPETLMVRLGLAGHLAAAERHEEAHAETAELLQAFRAAWGDAHPNTLACAVDHGINLLATGRPAEARETCGQAHAALRTVLGPEHPFGMLCRVNLANAEAALGETAKAERNYRQAHRELRDRLGTDHPAVLMCLGNLSVLLREAGRAAEAEQLAGESLDVLSAKLGSRHAKVVRLSGFRRVGLELDPHPV